MPEPLQKNFSIDIQQKLYEKTTSDGQLTVYQTSPFGMMLTMNNHIIFSESDSFFYHEMMAHPALFTHPAPQTIALIGNGIGILEEILKHTKVEKVYCVIENHCLEEIMSTYFSSFLKTKEDPRVSYHVTQVAPWLAQHEEETFDIIIDDQQTEDFLIPYYRVLHHDGILVKPCQSTLMQPHLLKIFFQHIKQVGFQNARILNFPQPSYPLGYRMIIMARKQFIFQRIREKDIFNKSFQTRYYNFDTHKAALALPEFMRDELEKVEA